MAPARDPRRGRPGGPLRGAGRADDYLSWYDVSTRKSDLKDAKAALYEAVSKKYPTPIEDKVKDLVVEDKWIATVGGAVQGEVERITQPE